MRSSLVVTFTGLDRPGIVDHLARIVADKGGNWEEAHMARLAGRFAGVVHVTAERDDADRLVVALRGLESEGLTVLIERGSADPVPPGRRLRLVLSGHDRRGIVRDVANALATRGITIVTLSTGCVEAPMSGGMIFSATAEVHAPVDLAIGELASTLDALADRLGVELQLTEGPC